jgi:myosin heavy subunit
MFSLQVFFRSGFLGHLEDMREEKLTGWVIRLQAISRGYLGRKNCKKIKVYMYIFLGLALISLFNRLSAISREESSVKLIMFAAENEL